MKVLGINAVFHDPAAALVVDGRIVRAVEEERLNRRKHGHEDVAFAAWELPRAAMAWCLDDAGLRVDDLDAIAYSYDAALVPPDGASGLDDEWDWLRTEYARRAPRFLRATMPGSESIPFVTVPHHLAHAASAALCSPYPECSVMTFDGRGENVSHLAGRVRDGRIDVLASQELPDSLGLLYSRASAHLGFPATGDEYKVMSLASYGDPRWVSEVKRYVHPLPNGGFAAHRVPWSDLVARRHPEEPIESVHADLAASVQACVEEVILASARWLHERTGDSALTLAGGVALNCVANARLAADGPFDEVWVQPAAGDAGTAIGAALFVARELGDRPVPMDTVALGPEEPDAAIETQLRAARVPYTVPEDLAAEVADDLAHDRVVGWFQGRSEFGPRALGHRSLLANPTHPGNVDRLNEIKGREQFRPVAPLVASDRAAEIFVGVLPSPYMLFVHDVRPEWRDRIPAVVHVDGTARAQTVDPLREPVVAAVLDAFAERTGVPVLINTSLNVAGRPMVNSVRDALELFGSSPLDTLALGPFLVRKG